MFKNCREIELSRLKCDVNQFRIREDEFSSDKLFITKDAKYLLCHSISEVSMGAYYRLTLKIMGSNVSL